MAEIYQEKNPLDYLLTGQWMYHLDCGSMEMVMWYYFTHLHVSDNMKTVIVFIKEETGHKIFKASE